MLYFLLLELRVARTDLEAMKKQAESTNAEYDRLAEEHQQQQVNFDLACKLHLQLHFLFIQATLQGNSEDKKDQ